jgi:hypothetical protein
MYSKENNLFNLCFKTTQYHENGETFIEVSVNK